MIQNQTIEPHKEANILTGSAALNLQNKSMTLTAEPCWCHWVPGGTGTRLEGLGGHKEVRLSVSGVKGHGGGV